jgi:carbonic anhydrase/acetyltransferase-like protein (isoleucine patch superfamily)
MKKYELGEKHQEFNLYRVVALIDFGNVKKGDVGGWVESEFNLSHEGNCWVSENAWVFGNAKVFDDAIVSGNARVFFGDAIVSENAKVSENAIVSENAEVTKCLFLQQFKHNITATDTHVFIGCECHTWEYWFENIKEIGETNGYSDKEIEDVKELLVVLKHTYIIDNTH